MLLFLLAKNKNKFQRDSSFSGAHSESGYDGSPETWIAIPSVDQGLKFLFLHKFIKSPHLP